MFVKKLEKRLKAKDVKVPDEIEKKIKKELGCFHIDEKRNISITEQARKLFK